MIKLPIDGGIKTDFEKVTHTLKVTINKPKKRNAFSLSMYQVLTEVLNKASNDSEVVFITITGASTHFFTSGNDLDNVKSTDMSIKDLSELSCKIFEAFVISLINCKKILVALVNGPAIGIGVTMLAFCDFVLASSSAYFHCPFMQLGLIPECCSSFLFPRNLGSLRANDLLLRGLKIDADTAKNWGLVNEVFKAPEFNENVKEFFQKSLFLFPKGALLESKELMRSQIRPKLLEVNEQETALLIGRWNSKETMEMISNFFSKKGNNNKAKL